MGVARYINPSWIARPSLRIYVGPDLLSAPHPAFGHLPQQAGEGEPAGRQQLMKSAMNSTCVNALAAKAGIQTRRRECGCPGFPHSRE